MVSPLADNGDMARFIEKNPAIDRLALLIQVAEGVKYLHKDKGIVHGDLKCRNVLIMDGKLARICDFGLSTVIVKTDIITATLIRAFKSVEFAAPELFSDTAYQPSDDNAETADKQLNAMRRSKTVKSDAYAFGGMVYEAYAGEPPWGQYAAKSTLGLIEMANKIRKHVLNDERPKREVAKPHAVLLSDALWEFCNECWTFAPSSRPKCDKIHAVVHEADKRAAPPV